LGPGSVTHKGPGKPTSRLWPSKLGSFTYGPKAVPQPGGGVNLSQSIPARMREQREILRTVRGFRRLRRATVLSSGILSSIENAQRVDDVGDLRAGCVVRVDVDPADDPGAVDNGDRRHRYPMGHARTFPRRPACDSGVELELGFLRRVRVSGRRARGW
jgi:hypothetical protein